MIMIRTVFYRVMALNFRIEEVLDMASENKLRVCLSQSVSQSEFCKVA